MFLDLNTYKQFLLEDFERNRSFAKLASYITFIDKYPIEDWVNGIEGIFLISFKQKLTFSVQIPNLNTIGQIEYTPIHYIENSNKYIFFTRKEYNSYEEAKRNFPAGYYVFNASFFKKINELLFLNFKDYEYNDEAYCKMITKSVSLKLIPKKDYTKFSDISEYEFPQIIIQRNNDEPYFFPLKDVREFLLLPSSSFLFFYLISNSFEIDKTTKMIIKVTRNIDQPVIYARKDNGYTITNSYDRLFLYNKYIFIILELYCHYFRVLERWLKKYLQ